MDTNEEFLARLARLYRQVGGKLGEEGRVLYDMTMRARWRRRPARIYNKAEAERGVGLAEEVVKFVEEPPPGREE